MENQFGSSPAQTHLLSARPNAFRTLFILESSASMVEFAPEDFDVDTLNMVKNRAEVPVTPLPSVKWTWQTWSIESLFEYARIAWDIYPNYNISVFAVHEESNPMNILPLSETWTQKDVNASRLRDLKIRMLDMNQIKIDKRKSNLIFSSSTIKIFQNLQSLESDELLCSPVFSSNLSDITSSEPFYIRIVIITSERDLTNISELLKTCIIDQNLSYLARYEIAVISVGCPTKSSPQNLKVDAGEDVFISWYGAHKGNDIVEALKECVAVDLKLSRTTVTDIPMKEDAKTGGSASFSFNLDLFHPLLVDPHAGKTPANSLKMKWIRPVKGTIPNYSVLENTLPLRASPSDPSTRPTQCLVGYVVDGNAVLLESPDTPPIACKLFLCGGKISLQQLKSGMDRTMEDVPTLAELPGGRVGTYRVKELVTVLSAFQVDPKTFPIPLSSVEKLSKTASYFPLVFSDSLVPLFTHFVPLLKVIESTNPRDPNWAAAREGIMEVMEMEKKAESLPAPSSHILLQHIPSSYRRSEGYAMVWAELDMILEANAHKSVEHYQLRQYLHNSLKRPIREELKATIRERVSKCRGYQGVTNPTIPEKDSVKSESMKKRKARPEFEGRLKYGRFGKLYPNLPKSDKRDDVLIHASIEL